MSDLAAAEAEAEVVQYEPRFSVTLGAMVGFLGSAFVSGLTLFLVRPQNSGGLAVAAGVGLAYALALLVWAGLWRRPFAVAAVLGASLGGLVCGFVLGLVLLWMAVPSARPNLVLA